MTLLASDLTVYGGGAFRILSLGLGVLALGVNVWVAVDAGRRPDGA